VSAAFIKQQSLGRILAGHPWVYTADIFKIEKPPPDGGEITLRTSDGAYVGNGFYNSRSRIPIRIFSRSKEKLDETFIRKRILEAVELRKSAYSRPLIPSAAGRNPRYAGGSRLAEASGVARVGEASELRSYDDPSALIHSISPTLNSEPGTRNLPSVCRLVWSEADFLPGLVVDRYGDTLVIQTLTLAMDQRKELIVGVLRELFQPGSIIERNDVASRTFEGLPIQKGALWGSPMSKGMVTIGRARFDVDLLDGQKTGAYLDQAVNQVEVGALAAGRRVLDCFTYHGGFALHAALAGAPEVEALDISEEAIATCRHNAALNEIPNIHWKAANVFDELNTRQKSKERFDLIILDPPSFTKSRAKLAEALRGYKEIHLRALKLLAPGGLLATFCCSHHVDTETFRAVALDAAFDARKILRLHRMFSQPYDHPIIPAIPETEYLKGFLFEVL